MNYLLFGEGCEEEVAALAKERDAITVMSVEAFLKYEKATEADKAIVYGEIDEIKAVMEHSFVYGFEIALIAKPAQRYLRETFEIPKDPKKALDAALEGECRAIDLLYCQDEIVLWSVLIGEAPPHGELARLQYTQSRFSRIVLLLKSFGRIFRLKRSLIRLKTYKAQEIETAASGIVVIAHDDHSCASSLVGEFLSLSHGKVVALLVSPSSVVGYLGYLYKAIFHYTKTLPKATGVVLSERLEVDAKPALEVIVDGIRSGSTPVVLEVHKKAIRLCASEKFWQKESSRRSDEKEVVRLASLPQSKGEVEYIQKHLPFFPHADTAKYQELFASLREEARTTSTFVVLIVLSTLLATVGLFLNSASVIIGAMLLAPLMQPIVSFSMGLLRFDMDLFWHGLRSVAVGVGLVLVTALGAAYLLPFQTMTSEIAGRLHPTLLDLIVAIVSGVAAAYAKNNPKIIGSLAGVSIAVALVPPIATAGIGIGWGDAAIFQNAFLLFLTNYAGIVFAAALTFMVLGFSPIKRAQKGLIISTLALLAISVPLYFSFSKMVTDARIKEQLQESDIRIDGKRVEVENILISHRYDPKALIIRCDVVSDFHFDEKRRLELKADFQKRIGPWLDADETLKLEALERYRY